jgi:predicted DCC family thiol-disulfide oxidoreductase YuxK
MVARVVDEDMRAQLPNLVIAGVEKAGTTSLFSYLGQHPDICAPAKKELNFFASRKQPDAALPPIEPYAEFFRHCRGERYRLEASPAYWYRGRRAIVPLRQLLDRPRIVLSLRDPVARAWSHFSYLKSMGRLDRGLRFDDFVMDCERSSMHLVDERRPDQHTPLSIGLYGEYIVPWLEAFDDDELRVVFAEHLFENPAGSVERLCVWLGLAPALARSFVYEARNETLHPRSKALAKAADALRRSKLPVLDRWPEARRVVRRLYATVNAGQSEEVFREEHRRRLEELYRESNAALADQLRGRGYGNFPAWLTP